MGVIVNSKISAINLLEQEKINVNRVDRLNGLPKILILNLMPNKADSEYQLLKLLGNSPIDVKVDFLYTQTYEPKNTKLSYLKETYKTLDKIKDDNYNGMIITGSPLEFVDFDDIEYWGELQDIMDYANENVKSTIYLCWAAVAGLYHNYKMPKHIVEKKVVGVFENKIIEKSSPLFSECGDNILSPHSRYFQIKEEDIDKIQGLDILSGSRDSGIHMVAKRCGKQIYITGHLEYCGLTLNNEYKRDLEKGISADLPRNYFPNDDTRLQPKNTWSRDSQKIIDNWITNYLI